ncbi:hypothetical protein WICPIJ_000821 [Wickerhamomyces pijperi]|uniref:Uncharacterized protein n=1 Tax=Wickerhamomyces pijperi TaxID=599730 RepID=A0A9P8QFQ0_WICPI|nr:hypothetical protein WICPIJ_000821 [Wickerhamomyces pijperi]
MSNSRRFVANTKTKFLEFLASCKSFSMVLSNLSLNAPGRSKSTQGEKYCDTIRYVYSCLKALLSVASLSASIAETAGFSDLVSGPKRSNASFDDSVLSDEFDSGLKLLIFMEEIVILVMYFVIFWMGIVMNGSNPDIEKSRKFSIFPYFYNT